MRGPLLAWIWGMWLMAAVAAGQDLPFIVRDADGFNTRELDGKVEIDSAATTVTLTGIDLKGLTSTVAVDIVRGISEFFFRGLSDEVTSGALLVAHGNDGRTTHTSLTWQDLASGAGADPFSVGSIQFNTSYAGAFPTGRLAWDDEHKTLAAGMEGSSVTLQIGQEQHVYARNTSGSAIPHGTVVYSSNANTNFYFIEPASASVTAQASTVLGVATEEIANGASGYVTTFGVVHDLNTQPFNDNDLLYLSAGTPGAMTATKPAWPAHAIRIGRVLNSHPEQGTIFVRIHWGLVDEPDAEAIEALTGTGFAARTTTNTWALRTMTAATLQGIAIADGDGVAGNPAIGWDYTPSGPSGDVAMAANRMIPSATGLLWEGLTADANEGLLAAADVTGDRTWTLPNLSGTVAMTSQIPTGANPTASVNGTAANGGASTFLRSDAAPALADPFTPADGIQNITGSMFVSSKLAIGTTSPISDYISYTNMGNNPFVEYLSAHGTTGVPIKAFYRTRGTESSPTANQNGDYLGRFWFQGWDTGRSIGATIDAIASAEWGTAGDATDNPTDIVFQTVPDGSGTLAERMRITSEGLVGIADSTPAALLTVGAGDLFQINASGNIAATGSGTQQMNGLLKAGSGTPTIATAAGDIYAGDDLEVADAAKVGSLTVGSLSGVLRAAFGAVTAVDSRALSAEFQVMVSTKTVSTSSETISQSSHMEVHRNSLVRVNPTNVWTITTIEDGLTDGMTLTLVMINAGNPGSLSDISGQVAVAGGSFSFFDEHDSLTLQWDATSSLWREISRADF